MLTISAFADEISPDPKIQIDVLKASAVNHIEFRSILGTNVLALTDLQINEFQALLKANNFGLSAIGSPIGKQKIDEPFGPHLEKFQRAIDLAKKFGTRNIRVFSFYPPDNFDGNWAPYRTEVMSRLDQLCERAEQHRVRLVHENEHRIYGDAPDRVVDLMTHLRASFGPEVVGAAYDAANFVFCGYDPWQGWLKSREWVVHLHIKDWKAGAPHGSIPGEGEGRIRESTADAVQRGYTGFATMEPHLLGGGPTGGVTGPDLFPKAIAAFKKICDAIGATYQ
ncbi:MAG: TIM barrel protein [Planctomycetota bacterium]|jgi:3-dehydroshikimate dehydratase